MSQNIDIQVVENIILLAKKHQVQSLELAVQDWRVRVDTQTQSQVQSQAQAKPVSPVQPSVQGEMPAVNEPAPLAAAEPQTQNIVSPMVGTFYRKASPEMAAFVEVGQQVNVGDVVCIVEAMKMMHQVKAEQAGRIKRIVLEDGAMVEYGQVLFELEAV